MTGLLDIAPETDIVTIRGRAFEVQGLPLEDIVELLRRFPDLRKLFGGGEEAMGRAMESMPGVMSAVIAGGLGYFGDAEQERAASRLVAHVQSKLFGAVLKLTMPEGIGPFVQGLATAFGGSVPATALPNGSLPL